MPAIYCQCGGLFHLQIGDNAILDIDIVAYAQRSAQSAVWRDIESPLRDRNRTAGDQVPVCQGNERRGDKGIANPFQCYQDGYLEVWYLALKGGTTDGDDREAFRIKYRFAEHVAACRGRVAAANRAFERRPAGRPDCGVIDPHQRHRYLEVKAGMVGVRVQPECPGNSVGGDYVVMPQSGQSPATVGLDINSGLLRIDRQDAGVGGNRCGPW